MNFVVATGAGMTMRNAIKEAAHRTFPSTTQSLIENLRSTYKRLRPWIPARDYVRCGDLKTCYDIKWGDRFIPASWVPEFAYNPHPNYELGLVQCLKKVVADRDKVVIVGGGIGITVTVAALRAGFFGSVECFEASAEFVEHTRRTAARNKLDNVTVHHAVVAKAIDVYGSGNDLGPVMPVSELPACDVLEMDCEGAEVIILREMTIRPRVIVVETHGCFNSPSALVASLLEERGYTVSDQGVAEPDISGQCEAKDVRILLGVCDDKNLRTSHP